MIDETDLYDDVAAGFHIRHVMTPRNQATCIPTTEAIEVAAARLSASCFDFAPVVDDAQKVVGIFEAKSLASSSATLVGDVAQPLTPRNTVDANAPLESLPRWLLECPFQIVLESKEPVGLVDAADLNKEPMRSLLFLHIAGAERAMAELIRNRYQQGAEWLRLLSEKRRQKIDEVLKQAQEGDVDTSVLECVYFTDLVTVICKSPIGDHVKPKLDWSLSKHGGGVGALRNAACHPVKPVLRRVCELQKLVMNFERLHDITRAAHQLLRERDPGGT